MEDPKRDIVDVVRALVTQPTLQQQADTLRKYFSPDVRFYHYYIDTLGLEDLIAVYQFAEVALNYQKVDFTHVAYDSECDIITLQISVKIRPALRLWTEATLEFLTILELEDFEPLAEEISPEHPQTIIEGIKARVSRPKKLKRVAVQRDYFERQPALVILPLIGGIYSSHSIRLMIGRLQALSFRIFRELVATFVPTIITSNVLHFSKHSPL